MEGHKLRLIAVAIYACGFGARATLLSLVTDWIPGSLRARLYSNILVIEQCGMLLGEPFLQSIFALAMNLAKPWLGLPFFCNAVGSPLEIELMVI